MVQRFLAVDIYQMSLVEPDVSRLGWGVVKFAGLLQVRHWLGTRGPHHCGRSHAHSTQVISIGDLVMEKSWDHSRRNQVLFQPDAPSFFFRRATLDRGVQGP